MVSRIECPIATHRFASLYPFQSRFLEVNGLRYHYLDEGTGDTLVLLHGNPTWSFYFRNLVTAFKNRYRVIVPDHMGCGLSEKPPLSRYGYRLADRVTDLTALLDHLRPQGRITLIVHDWGGMIGLAWALDHMDRLGRIVISNTAGFFPPGGKTIPRRLRLIRKPNPLMEWLALHLNLFARGALYLAPSKPLTPAVKAGLIAPYDSPAHRLATLKFVQDIPLSPQDPSGAIVQRVQLRLEEICRRPTLLIWGAHDFVFDRDYFAEWRRRIPQAEWHWLEDAGHYLFEDQPDRIIGDIDHFLLRHPM
jgi:haloalkane dehalogenase